MGKWVPDKPTKEMLQACASLPVITLDGLDLPKIYQAMLAAAPSPWQPIGKDQRRKSKILAIGLDVDNQGRRVWVLGDVYWAYGMELWFGGPFNERCQPSHFMPWPELPPLPNRRKKRR